jgi:subtilisin family serine protease
VLALAAGVLSAPGHAAAQDGEATVKPADFINPLRVVVVPADAAATAYLGLRGRWVDPVARRGRDGRPFDVGPASRAVSDTLRIVQLRERPTARHLRDLADAGATVRGVLPGHAYVVEAPEGRLNGLRGLRGVRWVGNYAAAWRVSGRLARVLERLGPGAAAAGRTVTVRAAFGPSADAAASVAAVRNLGEVHAWTDEGGALLVQVTVPVAALEELAGLRGVLVVEHAPRDHVMNNTAATVLGLRPAWDTLGCYGSNEVVAVADSGLDLGSTNPAALHGDLTDGAGRSRVRVIQDVVADGPQDPISGHGTHVAGSVLGNGLLSGAVPTNGYFPAGCYAGIAPRAQLVFQAMGSNNNPNAVYVPSDIGSLFRFAYTNGSRIHQNSWGSDAYGAYDSLCRDVDLFAFANPEMLISFSAGNAGTDTSPADGVIDPGSIGRPATAKNCLAVGATENDRPEMTLTWGTGWPSDYPAPPISTDRVGNAVGGMAAFSSRGPCGDGRIKPDLVAPGTYVASVRTHAIAPSTEVLWGNLAGDTNYCWSGGTSMAAPLASGAAAVLREWLRREHGLTNEAAVLLKALLLNGAQDLAPGQYGTGAARELAAAPNPAEGWGRLNLTNTLARRGSYGWRYRDGWTTPLSEMGAVTSTISVYATNHPLRVHLVWSDYPGSSLTLDTNYLTMVGGGLVNDLNLQVQAPDGAVCLPAARNPAVNLFYYTNNASASFYTSTGLSMAEQCRTPELPLQLTRLEQVVYDSGVSGGGIGVYVWAPDGAGGLPGTVLFGQTNTLPAGGGFWFLTIPVSLSITSQTFYVGAQQLSGSLMRQVRDYSSTSTRVYRDPGTGWTQVSVGDLWVHAYGSTPTNDHVNNVEGIVIDAPGTGDYRVVVSGVAVPRGPVRFAVALSGGLELIAPVALPASPVNAADFTARWMPVSGAADYRLDVATNAAFGAAAYVSGYSNRTVSATNCAVTGLTASATYYYRVRAWSSQSTSPDSATVSVTTLASTRSLEVTSAFGMADPPAGLHSYPAGTPLACSVTNSPATRVDAQSAVTGVCTGWVGTGSVAASGSTTNTGAFALNVDSSITWLWAVTDLMLSNQTVSVTTNVQARDTLGAGDGYRVVSPGNVTFQAGKTVRLAPGFTAQSGSVFRAVIKP